jgi:hypothetical protein
MTSTRTAALAQQQQPTERPGAIEWFWILVAPVVAALASGGAYLVTKCQGTAFPLARVDPSSRLALYESVAATSVGLLGLSIAAIAVLLTVDRTGPFFSKMRERHVLTPLISLLLSAVVFLTCALIGSTLAIVLDSTQGRSAVEVPFTFVATASIALVVISGLAFSLVAFLYMNDEESRGTESRGRG